MIHVSVAGTVDDATGMKEREERKTEKCEINKKQTRNSKLKRKRPIVGLSEYASL